jgi:hypothetical protein
MGTPLNVTEHRASPAENGEARAVILRELEKILDSAPFRASSRRKDFLSYVVHHSLEGRHELLKERIIGTEVFHRDADYATGDDPVVRVQAGEVRRRLEQYYHSVPADVPVRIEIPLGSYGPVFHWGEAAAHGTQRADLLPPTTGVPVEPIPPAASAPARRKWPWVAAAIVPIAAGMVIGVVSVRRSHKPPPTPLEVFWAPIFKTAQPVIICLAKPVVYRPSVEIYERYTRTHPGTFKTEAERDNEVLPLDPSERLTWGDMEVYPGYGVASGDAYAAVQISNLMVRMDKPSQVRIGNSYSFEDLRTSPAVVLGAFNNRWTMQMTSNLHFALLFNVGVQEQTNAGRLWSSQYDPRHGYSADYGVVTRLLDAKTGQFFISAAGIGSPGTQAAGELIANGDYLEQALRKAPPDWSTKNLQIVVQTNVIDAIPGPPHVVASYYW